MRLKDYPAQPGRIGYVIIQDVSDLSRYVLIRDCIICHEDSRITIPGQGLYDWEHGKLIQNAFPELTADQREIIMTGIHPPCWDLTMKDEDEDGR